MPRILILFTLLIYSTCINAETISGNLSLLHDQAIRLEGFNGLKTYLISSATIDGNGDFSLNYSRSDIGVGCLISSDNKPFIVLLSGEDIELSGEALSNTETIKLRKGKENLLFEQYAREHNEREQALSAWVYLSKIYQNSRLFSSKLEPQKDIKNEINCIKWEDAAFLNKLPKESYLSWFLPVKKLVSSVSTVAPYRTEEIPETIKQFRKLDYTDNRLYKSGLFKDAIESHFWLLENSGKSLDSVFFEMKISINAMIGNLVKDEKKLNEVTDYLFDLLERHSLFQASEYLALKVLNEVSCTINSDLAKQLETYRAMKKGNIAPDFVFYPNTIFPSDIPREKTQKLSDLKTSYTLVVFGASTCPKCAEEIPQIAEKYPTWKAQGVEVIFISLDENENNYQQFIGSFPFISSSDFKKWSSPIVESYFVFGTPTMFLLDNERKILLRPNSVNQMDAWVDWFLVKENH